MSAEPDQTDIPLGPLRLGDPGAFALLVERHQSIVLGLCQAMGLRGADLDDAAAEVFANVFRALPRFEGRSQLGTWVYRIACRTIPKVRARYRQRPTGVMPEDPVDSAQPTPLQASETSDTNRRIWEAVAELNEREAMAIELYYRREFPIEQIAQVMARPEGTIKTLLFRGRQKLKKLLTRREIGI